VSTTRLYMHQGPQQPHVLHNQAPVPNHSQSILGTVPSAVQQQHYTSPLGSCQCIKQCTSKRGAVMISHSNIKIYSRSR